MQIVGTDKDGYPIAIQRGLVKSTIYRGTPKSNGLHDLAITPDVLYGSSTSGFNWQTLFTGLNPIIQGIGAKIAGGNPYPSGVIPINPYAYDNRNVQASGPGFAGTMNPMYIMMAAGLGLVLLLKR